jgi:hypothetical protein
VKGANALPYGRACLVSASDEGDRPRIVPRMYNFLSMKLSIAIALVSFSALAAPAPAPDDLDDSYAKLKADVEKKDPDAVKADAATTLKLVKEAKAKPKPADADEAKDWENRNKYGDEIQAYTDYALATTANQPDMDPAKTVELISMLVDSDPKSKYIDEVCANAYYAALGKTGGKQVDAMAKIAAGRPDNVFALTILTESYGSKNPAQGLNYANKLIAAAKKPRPEDIPEAAWDKTKSAALATGYYYAGFAYGQRQQWLDCDKSMGAALPLVSGDQIGVANYMLGLCRYQFGKLTNDRTKMTAGQALVEKAAGIKGPMQDQAYRTNLQMKQELGARH